MFNKILILLIAAIAVFAIYIAIKNSVPQKSRIEIPLPSNTPTITSGSSLSFIPDKIYAKKGQGNIVDIQINSQGKYPTLLQLEIAYDPAVITDVSLVPGALYPDPNILLNLIDEKNGRISYALGLKPGQTPNEHNGTAVKLNFSINTYSTQKQTSIYFLPKTSILSDGSNIPLKIATGLKIFLNAPTIATSPPF